MSDSTYSVDLRVGHYFGILTNSQPFLILLAKTLVGKNCQLLTAPISGGAVSGQDHSAQGPRSSRSSANCWLLWVEWYRVKWWHHRCSDDSRGRGFDRSHGRRCHTANFVLRQTWNWFAAQLTGADTAWKWFPVAFVGYSRRDYSRVTALRVCHLPTHLQQLIFRLSCSIYYHFRLLLLRKDSLVLTEFFLNLLEFKFSRLQMIFSLTSVNGELGKWAT